MVPSDIAVWTKAEPFRPFRIVMSAGRFYDVRHPELVIVLEDSLIHSTPVDEEDTYRRAQMIGLSLIDRIEPIIDPPADAPKDKPSRKRKA